MNFFKHQKKLNKIFRKNQVVLAYLFGSVARKKMTSLSDIDIAVLFSEKVKKDEYFDKRLELATKIGQVLKGKEIDIVCLNEAPPLLKHRAVFYGICIFTVNSKLKRDFEFRVLQEYEDFNYYLERSYKAMEKHLKKGIFGKALLSPKQEKSFLKYVNR